MNEYFNPDLFRIIENELFWIPMWTGIMLDKRKINLPIRYRLQNNPAESRMNHFKNHLNLKNNCPNIIFSALYNDLISTCIVNYPILLKSNANNHNLSSGESE